MIKIDVFNIETLAAKAKVSRRTIHYYLQRGLLMPPQGAGRGSHYNEEHLTRLNEIQTLTSQGVPLAKMKECFEGKENAHISEVRFQREGREISQPKCWERYAIADGIELQIQIDTLPVDSKRTLIEFIEREVQKRFFQQKKSENQ